MTYDLLHGLRVVELTMFSTDTVGGHLADMGADVVKIEEPPYGTPTRHAGSLHFRWNRGKRSVMLSLKEEGGTARLLDLVRDADVFIYGLRAGAASRFGVDYDAIRAINSDIVYCAISGFGQDGLYRDLASHGWAFDAVAGLAVPDIDGDGLPRTPDSHTLVGIEAAGMFGAIAILAALRKAERTGESQLLDIAGVDSALTFRATDLDMRANDLGNTDMSGYVRYQYYPTKEDEFVMFMALEDKFWKNFCEAAQRADLFEPGLKIDDPKTDEAERTKLRHALADLFRTRTRAEWTELFIASNVAGAPAYRGLDVLEDPHIAARGLTYDQEQPDGRVMHLFGTPIKVNDEKFQPGCPPGPGEHTDEILQGAEQ
jgi:crotonobetainyl-CoA:carnitine CoA-transferase CaiB-like acyl-CoA transferase